MRCSNDCAGNPSFALDGVCDDGGEGSDYAYCEEGTDCSDCGRRYRLPPMPPPSPPRSPSPPFSSPPPLPQLRTYPPMPNSATDMRKEPASGGETLAGEPSDLSSSSFPLPRILDYELLPVEILKIRCRYGRKLEDPDLCSGLSPSRATQLQTDPDLGLSKCLDFQFLTGDLRTVPMCEAIPHAEYHPPAAPTFSGVSYTADYLATRPPQQLAAPWYGYESNRRIGVWVDTPSSILVHRGHLVVLDTPPEAGCSLPALRYMRPGARSWRVAALADISECNSPRGGKEWRSTANFSAHPHSYGFVYDPSGTLADRDGNLSQHIAAYYSFADGNASERSCIGRVTGRLLHADEQCAPMVSWQVDERPVMCSGTNSTAFEMFPASEPRAPPGAIATAAEPFYGFDGSLYLAFGDGAIFVTQLNESDGRLQAVWNNQSEGVESHLIARGPSFQLGEDLLASPDDAAAYVDGKVMPMPDNASLVRNPFILPINLTQSNGTTHYFLFVDWYGGAESTRLSRIHVGRSIGSPTGPYRDRDGNDMKQRRRVVLGGERLLRVKSARWGANCDGVGYDVLAVAKLKCEGLPSCAWTVLHEELDSIRGYSNFQQPTSTTADQYSLTPNVQSDYPGCARALNVSYTCALSQATQYVDETTAVFFVGAPGEAANGSVVRMDCSTPEAVFLPGGSLFADARTLGGSLRYAGASHSGVFAYEKGGEQRYVFTFRYFMDSESHAELGARRLFFGADGWPYLDQDQRSNWGSCSEPSGYASSTGSGTHCRYHSSRGSHCVGDSLRATHPELGSAGERIRGCKTSLCAYRPPCRPDPLTRALTGSLDSCGDGLSCKLLPQRGVRMWDQADFFDGGVPWRVTRDGLQMDSSSIDMDCHAAPRVSRITPTNGVIEGGTAVTIHGRGFGSGARCRFGAPRGEVAARNITAHSLICDSPPLRSIFALSTWTTARFVLSSLAQQAFAVEVSAIDRSVLEQTELPESVRLSRGGFFSEDKVPFRFYDYSRVRLSFVRPQGGPAAGGTHIDVHGSGFRGSTSGNTKCRFGAIAVQATFHNSHRISCYSPTWEVVNATGDYSNSSEVALELTLDEQKYTAEWLTVAYYALQNSSVLDQGGSDHAPLVAVSALDPTGGPALGGTLLSVWGTGFFARGDPSAASFDAREYPSNMHLADSGEPRYDLHRPFVGRAGVFCIFRNAPSPIPGSNYPGSAPLAREAVPARIISASLLQCRVPALAQLESSTHRLTVEVTVNGDADDRTSSSQTFLVYRDDVHLRPRLQSVQPFGGPVEGNTSVIIHAIHLRRLVDSRSPTCRFGSEVVSATFESFDEATQRVSVRCVSPPIPAGDAGSRTLSVSPNAQEYVRRSLRFAFFDPSRVAIRALEPSGGPARGGTRVVVRGRHLVDLGGLRCLFGDVVVPATAMDPDSLLCRAPAYSLDNGSSAVADVRIVLNGDALAVANASQLFTFFDPSEMLAISSIYPRAGPMEGGTMVTIFGPSMLDLGGTYCIFGSSLPVLARVRNASDGRLGCVSPVAAAADPAGAASGALLLSVAVRLTINNDTFGEPCAESNFTFYPL